MAGNGEWGMGNGEWGMGNGEWGSGKSIPAPGVRCNWAVVPAPDSIGWPRQRIARPSPMATATASAISRA
ncbi:hypothetical protein XavaCFBP5823_02560 [Xanthomonas axonopodis pv. vasculorum]|nr:hypothetical protein XavaCFBP5823_02560 [Xanthomonas axonopodis pv. vasculorum]